MSAKAQALNVNQKAIDTAKSESPPSDEPCAGWTPEATVRQAENLARTKQILEDTKGILSDVAQLTKARATEQPAPHLLDAAPPLLPREKSLFDRFTDLLSGAALKLDPVLDKILVSLATTRSSLHQQQEATKQAAGQPSKK
jgi:hypothetical protein